jgi:hypothetical protein
MRCGLICLSILAVVLLAGCSGQDTIPVVRTNQVYFPLSGNSRALDLRVKVEIPSLTFNPTEAVTGTVVLSFPGTQALIVDGSPLNASVLQCVLTSTSVPGPDFGDAAAAAVIDGMLSPITARTTRGYYASVPNPGDPVTGQQVLVAQDLASGPTQVPIPIPRPFLDDPVIDGVSNYTTSFFIPSPLNMPETNVSNLQIQSKLLGFESDLVALNEIFSANVTANGESGTISGQCKNYFRDGVGFIGARYAAMVVFGDRFARLSWVLGTPPDV